ncbi:LPS assembly protein LptD [bacterium]|nr:LPS assembly protein LptD [bacterium]MBU1884058.1 LPS assembly protein LptD [bacterium]
MRKLWLLLILFPLYLFGADKVEVYASHLDNNAGIVKASGDVVVLYKDYYISATDAIYDRENGNLELFGNVRATQGSNYQLLGDYARLNISDKERVFKPFYMLEQKSQLWMSADEGNIKDKYYDVTTGMISGCNPNKPLWKIKFSSSNYDGESKWMNLWNARLYIYDIPIFYMPYFGYSLDTTRRSGLLIPAFGISSDEGFYYEQPIYIALTNWWDLELKPQVRTLRGSGSYETFRFADSKTSGGSFTTGYFKENSKYVTLNSLAHDTHYGFNFQYTNDDFLNRWFGFDLDGQSGIYADISHMNDVDYINLSTADTINNATSNQVLSQVNMFYNTDRNYFGTYFKYYQNLALESNAKTVQKLPTLQYHNYLSTFLDDHLMYDIDFTSTNLYRELGTNALQSTLNVPVSVQTSIFDEYINLSYESVLYGEHITFGGTVDPTAVQTSNGYPDGVLLRQYNIFDVKTNMTKAYEDFTHTMTFGLEYVKPGSEAAYGFYKTEKTDCALYPTADVCKFYTVSDVVENVGLDFSQYLFDTNGSQFLYHKLSQQISYASGKGELGDVENELDYDISKTINYYNDTFYNYTQHQISKTINSLSYTDSGVKVKLSYLYKDSFIEPTSSTPRFTRYLTSSLTYKYNDHYSYFGNYNYDVQAALKKSSEIGFLYSKRCWDFGLRYVENVRPILSSNTASKIEDRYIFFTVTLKPIGGADMNYRIPKSIKGE